jgi:hypothetical protein
MTNLITVVETEPYLRQAKAIMGEEEREGVLLYLAANLESGVSLGGGLRKVRISRPGGGKSGGYRTLYVFGGMHMPLFLLTVFAKNEKDNLTKAEQAAAVELARKLVASYGVPK